MLIFTVASGLHCLGSSPVQCFFFVCLFVCLLVCFFGGGGEGGKTPYSRSSSIH